LGFPAKRRRGAGYARWRASWSRQTLPTKFLLLGGAFVDEQHGWLVGAGANHLADKRRRHDPAQRYMSATAQAPDLSRPVSWGIVWAGPGRTAGRVFATTDGGRALVSRSERVSMQTCWT